MRKCSQTLIRLRRFAPHPPSPEGKAGADVGIGPYGSPGGFRKKTGGIAARNAHLSVLIQKTPL